jgi:hypothetical protein
LAIRSRNLGTDCPVTALRGFFDDRGEFAFHAEHDVEGITCVNLQGSWCFAEQCYSATRCTGGCQRSATVRVWRRECRTAGMGTGSHPCIHILNA